MAEHYIKKHKACNKCGVVKHLREYTRNRRMSDGFLNTCKICKLAYLKKYRSSIRIKKFDPISKMPSSPRPYVVGSIFDGKESTAFCVLRLAFNYLEEGGFIIEDVLKKCKVKFDEEYVFNIYKISDKEGFVYPKMKKRKNWKVWGEKLYWDLKDIGMYNLAEFIYDKNNN